MGTMFFTSLGEDGVAKMMLCLHCWKEMCSCEVWTLCLNADSCALVISSEHER